MRMEKEWQTCPYCGVGSSRGSTTLAPSKEVVTIPVAAPPPARQSRLYRVLIVDDDADIRLLTAMILKRSSLPLSTSTASDGPSALEQVHADPPDLILLDLMMPGMDGFEVCRQLRANVRTAFLPILMVTARDDAASRVEGFLVGTDDYIGKPFDNAELAARVRRLLERTYGALLPPLPQRVSAPESMSAWKEDTRHAALLS